MIQDLKDNYGHLFEDKLLEEISRVGTFKEVPEGYKLMEIGQYIRTMPLLIDGAIKIMRDDDDGDELLLYFLERGETCAMTLSCCLGDTKSEIRAIAELDTKLIFCNISLKGGVGNDINDPSLTLSYLEIYLTSSSFG